MTNKPEELARRRFIDAGKTGLVPKHAIKLKQALNEVVKEG